MTELGMKWRSKGDGQTAPVQIRDSKIHEVNTRTSLWPDRWPAIAKQSCIDTVEAAPPEQRAQVKFDLPCSTCELRMRCLNARRKEIGSLMYDREIMTSPRTSESSLFPEELVLPLCNRGEALVPHYRKPFGAEHEYVVVQAWDIAWSEKTGGDWLVCMTGLANLRSGRRQLLDIDRWQRKTFQQQLDLIEARWATYAADLVVIESDAAQQIWKQQVAANTSVPVMQHAAAGGKHSLAVGVPSLLIKFENRKWEFPYAEGSYHHEHIETFLSELEAFGWVDGQLQGIGEHDDTVMAFWHLDWGIDRLVREAVRERHVGMQPGRQQ